MHKLGAGPARRTPRSRWSPTDSAERRAGEWAGLGNEVSGTSLGRSTSLARR